LPDKLALNNNTKVSSTNQLGQQQQQQQQQQDSRWRRKEPRLVFGRRFALTGGDLTAFHLFRPGLRRFLDYCRAKWSMLRFRVFYIKMMFVSWLVAVVVVVVVVVVPFFLGRGFKSSSVFGPNTEKPFISTSETNQA
jgi:Flp pilus assembly protein TadB